MQRWLKLMVVVALAAAVVTPQSALIRSAYAGTTTYTPSRTHYTSVYLSPANQPNNIGCDGYSETAGARAMASAAKDALFSWGYIVHVGDGVVGDNIADSNRLRPNLHVPIHSNAKTTSDCAGTNPRNGGTWIMFRQGDASGINATNRIYPQLQPWSPGTNDATGTDVALTGAPLAETQNTQAPTAFVEVAFHTYGPDEDWLRNMASNGRKIATGIDNYFGNPRCGVNRQCPLREPPQPPERLAPPPLATPPTNLAGKPLPDVKTAVENVLKGPSSSARTADDETWFSEKTAGMLKQLRITPDGVLVVSFADWSKVIPNASTSAGRHVLLHDLNDTIFTFPAVKSIVYQSEGSCDRWWGFLQAPCHVVTRDAWREHVAQE